LLFYLNVSALILILLVTAGITWSTWRNRNRLFYITTVLLLIPAFAQIRQLLAVTGNLFDYPLFIFLVYFLLRIIGPLMNWYTHIHFNKPFNYKSGLNLITYALLLYVVIDFFYALSLPVELRASYVGKAFQEKSFFSFTYPIIQLAHMAQAIYLIKKEGTVRKSSDPIFFVRYILYTVVITLLFLQASYFVLERRQVELVVAPIIFLVIYGVIILVSMKYSTLQNTAPPISPKKERNIEFLSDRENQVLKLVAAGKSDQEIADELKISYHTVRTYCKRIFEKMEVKNRIEAAHFYNSSF